MFCLCVAQGQEEVPAAAADGVDVVPGSQLLWRMKPRPANSAQVPLINRHCELPPEPPDPARPVLMCVKGVFLRLQMYSFTSFAMQLNELWAEMEGTIPRTDCRLRPDIRAMENGDIGKKLWRQTGPTIKEHSL